MTYIEDQSLFKAVSFASSMMKKGINVGIACKRAGDYYDVSSKDIASELGKRGASVTNSRKKKTDKIISDFYN